MSDQQIAQEAQPVRPALPRAHPTISRRRTDLIGYGVTTALGIVLTIFFGWYGFWLAVGLVVAVRVAIWGVPLIKLSYADEQAEAPIAAQAGVDTSTTR